MKLVKRTALQLSWISARVSNYLLKLSANTETSQPQTNNFNWQNVKKVLVATAAFSAVFQAFLPDGTPGSPRSIVLGLGLGAAAAAAGL